MKITVVINPRSGKKRAESLRGLAEQLGHEGGHELEFHTIAAPGDGKRFAEEAIATGMDLSLIHISEPTRPY